MTAEETALEEFRRAVGSRRMFWRHMKTDPANTAAPHYHAAARVRAKVLARIIRAIRAEREEREANHVYEIRDDSRGELDEIVAEGVDFLHLERMDRDAWWMSVNVPGKADLHVWFTRHGKTINASVREDPPHQTEHELRPVYAAKWAREDKCWRCLGKGTHPRWTRGECECGACNGTGRPKK